MTRAQAEALLEYVDLVAVMHAAVHTAARHGDPPDGATLFTRQAAAARAAFLATVDPESPDAPAWTALVSHLLKGGDGAVHLLCGEATLCGGPGAVSSLWPRVTCPECKAKATPP